MNIRIGISIVRRAGGSGAVSGAPVNTVAPVVSGTATVGQTLTTTNGTWTGDATIVYTYRWHVNGASIIGATASTYALTAYDVGKSITCVVTGTNGAGYSTGTSNAITGIAALTSTTFVQNGITLTTSVACEWSVSVDGQIGIITPGGGVTVSSRSPAQTTDGGLMINGSVKNPQRGDAQGYDARLTARYDVTKLTTFPAAMAQNDVLLCAIAHVPATNRRLGCEDAFAGFHFIPSAWPSGTFAPSIIGWSGRGAPAAYQVDVDAIVATLPSYNITAMPRPALATVMPLFDRLEVAWGQEAGTGPDGYEYQTTYGASGDLTTGNYGQLLGTMVGSALHYMTSNEATTAEKRQILVRAISSGIQTYDPIAGSGVEMGSDGGHWQFTMAQIAMALHYTGRAALLATLNTVAGGNPLNQSFIYDAGIISHLAPHSNTSYPAISRLRNVSAVAGNVVTVDTTRTGLLGDPSRMGVRGLRMVRPSDGATAIITSQPDGLIASGAGTKALTIDAQPSPAFAPSDTVYFQSQYAVAVGDADFSYRLVTSGGNEVAVNPGTLQDYRETNEWSEEVFTLRALGIWHSDFDPVEQYVARSVRVNDPSPSSDYPAATGQFQGIAFAAAVWGAYAQSVIGQAPVHVTSLSISGVTSIGAVLTVASGAVAGTAPITKTYQWYADGAAISGATASTYTIVAGDLAKVITVTQTSTNTYGASSLTSQPVGPVDTTYEMVLAGFDGSTYLDRYEIIPPSSSTKFMACITLEYIGTRNGIVLSGRRLNGTERFTTSVGSDGAVYIALYNTAGTLIWAYFLPANTITAGGVCTLLFGIDTSVGMGSAYVSYDGTAWSAVTPTYSTYVSNGLTSEIGRMSVAASDAAGTSKINESFIGDVWVDFANYLDLSNSTNRAKFARTQSKGADGSLPTGTVPALFLSGALSSWEVNKAGYGGMTLYGGPLVSHDAPPTPGAAPTLYQIDRTSLGVTQTGSYDLRHSLDEATWTTVTGSPTTISGLAAGTLYYVQTATPGVGNWSVSTTKQTVFGYTLRNEAGSSTIAVADLAGIRLYSGGTWQSPSALGLTATQDVDGEILISGFASGAVATAVAAAGVHYEQQIPGEPYSAADTPTGTDSTGTSIRALHVLETGRTIDNASQPGLPVVATRYNAPVVG